MNPFTVFVKPWKDLALEAIAARMESLGVQGIELPVRAGFPVNPGNVHEALPQAERLFASRGLRISSIASEPTREIVSAIGRSETKPMLRVMLALSEDGSYREEERAWIRRLGSLAPDLESAGVRLGIQNHDGRFVSNACGVRRILDALGCDAIGAVWDPAHCALAGEKPEYALDLLRDSLFLVNFKNPEWYLLGKDDAGGAVWHRRWVAGCDGISSWLRVAELLAEANYRGDFCLCAEYTSDDVDGMLADDVRYLRSVCARVHEGRDTAAGR